MNIGVLRGSANKGIDIRERRFYLLRQTFYSGIISIGLLSRHVLTSPAYDYFKDIMLISFYIRFVNNKGIETKAVRYFLLEHSRITDDFNLIQSTTLSIENNINIFYYSFIGMFNSVQERNISKYECE